MSLSGFHGSEFEEIPTLQSWLIIFLAWLGCVLGKERAYKNEPLFYRDSFDAYGVIAVGSQGREDILRTHVAHGRVSASCDTRQVRQKPAVPLI